MSIATGDYIYIIGTDDCLYDDTVISRVVAQMQPDDDIWLAGVISLKEDTLLERYYCNPTIHDATVWDGFMSPHQGIFARKWLLEKHPFDTSYNIIADWKWLLTSIKIEHAHLHAGDFPVAYYSMDGYSGPTNKQKWDQERARLEEEFHLQLVEPPVRYKALRTITKRLCRWMGIYNWIKYQLDYRLRGWQKHHCHNRHCRWCQQQHRV